MKKYIIYILSFVPRDIHTILVDSLKKYEGYSKSNDKFIQF